ncbi:MAG: hypothetical protein ACRDLL_01210 [Solirubrobacterales bacterium]
MSVIHYLLVYDLRAGRLLRTEEFENADEAAIAYGQAEREHLDQPDIEIVLIGADSIDTIRRTHGHYFATGGPDIKLPELAGV